ncbi:DUF1573 domain-containing protein [Mucilaginibacter sabulilitoris]|uniref:DUF1573 domain-containing protein n=1 Tax=Mucilaginibacter sabulilitoris TaxID=1173583 RepID=A0ABZ0THN5_9SPHI|nr:DUF1573 domain-containing protein [Mucilaginibacter sabulilitoris]WPU92672.1 DUF1573 domain-containing protein [Mucilaginibacter sabulilitoris]
MKKLFLSLITAAALLSACNQTSGNGSTAENSNDSAATKTEATSANAANAPVMKFEKESHDFGKIKTGDKVSYDFKFTNNGKSPLIITDAVASCGCTTPEWPKTPVKPGESGLIKVVFNSAGKSGLQDKQITITANTVPAQNMVHLIGEVLTK